MNITQTKTQLNIKLTTTEKIFGFHGDFTIPRKNITKTSVEPTKTTFFAIRWPAGIHLPGFVRTGHYWTPKGGREYWYKTKSHKIQVVIELKNENFNRLVLGFESKSTIPKELLF